MSLYLSLSNSYKPHPSIPSLVPSAIPNRDTQSLFNNQEHLVIFKDVTDLQKKVDYYLKHPEECLKIAENGYQEVLKKHTYRHRLTDILQTIESL